MTCEFPRAYDIVRHGRPEPVRVENLDELVALRTELELIRRFGAGASTGLIEAIDRRLAEVSNPPDSGSSSERVQDLEDMRAIFRDSLSPVNTQALAAIDRDCPEAIAGTPMDSINEETQAFREDLKGQLAGSEEDVDALLASLAEAEAQANGQADARTGGEEPAAAPKDADLDSDLQSLLAEAAGKDESADPGLDELVASISGANSPAAEPEPAPVSLTQASETQAALAPTQDQQPAAQPDMAAAPVADGPSVTIENVTEHVAQSLTTAEAQLEAIASAFEVAAAELGSMSNEVAEAVGPAAQPTEAAQDDVANLAAWDAEAAPAAVQPQVEMGPVENSQPVEEQSPAPTAPAPAVGPAVNSPAQTRVTAGIRPAGQLRTQLKQARANILSELDDLLSMLDRVDQMQAQADQAIRKAREFEQAAARAQAAGQALAAAEADAAKARATFEQAESRAVGARQAWEQAQQAASAAAETCQTSAA